MVKRILLFALLSISLSCSQFSNSPTSKAWHNLNARYNAIIDAQTYYKYSVFLIDSAKTEDYSVTLPIITPIDSNYTKIASKGLNEVVRLTSLVAERHSNSRHLDDAYLLLGQARYYKGEFLNALEVFKYLNTNFRKEQKRHAGLIWLMKSYMEMNSINEAEQVAQEIENFTLSKSNKADYFEARAALYQRQSEPALAVVYLEEALKNMKKGLRKARGHYIAGQLFRELGRGSQARQNWLLVVKNKPTYELEFNAGIELLMLGSDLGANTNVTFSKMLEDRKNSDLKDKIYMKLAESRVNQGNYQQAVEDFGMAAALSKDKTSKAAAYRRIAEVYYQNISDYGLAAKYYDSTLLNMNPMVPGYSEVTERSKSLTEFVLYQNVIKTEDSLQALAALNPLELEDNIAKMLENQEDLARQRAAEEKKAKEERENQARSGNSRAGNSGWLFYDQVTLTRSRAAFIREWGNRPLEDNWRRKDKELGSISFKVEKGIAGLDDLDENEALKEQEEARKIAEFESKKQAFIDRVPTTEVKMGMSKRRQEEAYYQLGKIYRFQFNQLDKAKQTFDILLTRFPNSAYEQEVLYFMALMSADPSTNKYATQLIDKFPFSTYARQLERGNVQITAATESNAERDYEVIFNEYKAGSYENALLKADKALYDYTGTALEDKIAMMRILLLAKKQDTNKYRIALLDFLRSYPSSELKPQVEGMLAAMTKN